MRLLPLALLTAAIACAGCLESEPEPLSDTSFSLTLTDVPDTVAPNATFTVQLTVLSITQLHTSDHVGAHLWARPPANPTAEISQATACQHMPNPVTLPGGPFLVTCKAPAETGVYYIKGHARITEDATTWDWWSFEPDTFTVRAA